MATNWRLDSWNYKAIRNGMAFAILTADFDEDARKGLCIARTSDLIPVRFAQLLTSAPDLHTVVELQVEWNLARGNEDAVRAFCCKYGIDLRPTEVDGWVDTQLRAALAKAGGGTDRKTAQPTPKPWIAVTGQGAHPSDWWIRAAATADAEGPAVARACSAGIGTRATVEANAHLIAAAPELYEACKVLAAIADAYDDNALDDEARKTWGDHDQHENTRSPQDIELYNGRGGRRLLTLADCFAARAALAKAGGAR